MTRTSNGTRAATRGRRLQASIGAVVGAVALAATLSGCTRTPLTTGHIDALDVDYDGTNLTLDVRNHTVSPINDDVDPATLELHAVPASQTTVPADSRYAFLGPAGAPVWILPQTQRTGVLWPGWDTNDVPAGAFQSDRVTVRLASVSGPGQFTLYTVNSLGSPTVLLNSADGLPDAFNVSRGVHAHANWAFGAAGTYTLTFEVTATTTGGATKTSGQIPYQFVVGS
jgi:surface-anchored protein